MKRYPSLLLIIFCSWLLPTALRAVPPADPLLTQGLQTCLTNGLEDGVRAWYPDRPELGAEMSRQVLGETQRLGTLIDTEVVTVQSISKRVTRYYFAIYFTRSPLWVRIDRYENRDKSFFMPLKCSTNPDDILPGYVTEFLR